MLRVQSGNVLDDLEKETLANMERDGLRQAQFVKSNNGDRQRAISSGWDAKLLDFEIPDGNGTYEAVLDSLGGFTLCSDACAYFFKLAAEQGVKFKLGPQGEFASLLLETGIVDAGKKRAVGLNTTDGVAHKADVVVIAGKYTILRFY